jgi:cell division protein FtsQ
MNWRNPRRWRDVLLGAGLLLGVVACTWQGIKPEGSETGHLYISGDAAHVSDERIARIASPYLEASFFDVDLEGLQAQLSNLAWLREVKVSRHWPDGVVVRVSEHEPVARWGQHGLLARDGQVFTPGAKTRAQDLIQLDGPDTAGLKVHEQFQALTKILVGHEVTLASLALDARGSWTAQLADGLELRLGRDHIQARFVRFVRYALGEPRAHEQLADAGYIDLRYSDGFAIGGKRAARDDQEKDDEQAA